MLTRRGFLKYTMLATGGLAIAPLLAACGQQPAPAAPAKPAEPAAAKPTEAPKPAEAAKPAAPAAAAQPTTAPAAKPAEAAKPAAAAPAQAAPATAKMGGKLILAGEADPGAFDTTRGGGPSARRIIRAIYDPLLELDESGKMVPALVEKWEQPNDTTYIFHIRQGIKFHDGTPLDAEAVKFHFDRHFDPEIASQGKSELGPIDKVEIVDPMTVKITLKAPFAPFLYGLFDRPGFVISPTAWQKWGPKDYGFHPVGTGPFKFVSYSKDNETVVEKNPDYWRKGQPYLDSIVFRAIPADATRVTELRSGGVHIAEQLPFQDVARLKGMSDIVVSEKDGFRWDAFCYQTQHKPWDNPKMRQVLNYALDREAIHQTVYFGTGSIGYDPFLPETPFFDPKYKPYTRNLDMAKRLLDESGYSSSTPLEAQVNLDEPHQKAFQIAQANLAEIGLKLNISVLDTTTQLQRSRDGQYDMGTTWWGYRPDPDGWINGKFHSKGSINFTFLSDPDLDKLIDAAQRSQNLDERVKLYRQTADKINEDGTHTFFHYGSSIRGLSPKVKGAVHFVDAILRFHTVSLE